MRPPATLIRAFLLWRLTSGWWLYAMIAAGWWLIISGLGLGVLWAWMTLSRIAAGAQPPIWPALAGIGCLGAGLFILLFEVGWTDLRLAGAESMRIRRIRGDDEIYEQMLRDGRRRREMKERYQV